MKVLLLRTWLVNVGNGFIDKGAKECLKRAIPNANIIEVSGHSNNAVDRKIMGKSENVLRGVVGLTKDPNDSIRQNTFNIADLIKDVDVAVLPGWVLSEDTIRRYYTTLKELSERQIPLIFLGAGGSYSPKQQSYVKKYLGKLNLAGIITRDSTAYEIYSECFPEHYDGIDCGFFINDWYQPPKTNERFLASTFDKMEEPKLRNNIKKIRPNHVPFAQPFFGRSWEIANTLGGNRYEPTFEKKNTFVSDLLEDYLFLYANTEECHSDRIHACVPTLAYGNSAKFYFDTERSALFNRIEMSEINNKPVTIDSKVLKEEKEKQISRVGEMIESAC